MRVLVWISEIGWEACVDAAKELDASEITLVHGPSAEALEASRGAMAGLLGRHRRPDLEERFAQASTEAAEALLDAAAQRLGRPAQRQVVTGDHPEQEIARAARDADLLVAARSGRRLGPKSIRHPARFVVDHAPCPLLLVWPPGGPEGDFPRPPEHDEHHAPPGPHHP